MRSPGPRSYPFSEKPLPPQQPAPPSSQASRDAPLGTTSASSTQTRREPVFGGHNTPLLDSHQHRSLLTRDTPAFIRHDGHLRPPALSHVDATSPSSPTPNYHKSLTNHRRLERLAACQRSSTPIGNYKRHPAAFAHRKWAALNRLPYSW